jgi:hypothetical protein
MRSVEWRERGKRHEAKSIVLWLISPFLLAQIGFSARQTTEAQRLEAVDDKPREGCDSARSCFIASPAIGDLSPEKLLEDCGRIHLIHSGASICDADC